MRRARPPVTIEPWPGEHRPGTQYRVVAVNRQTAWHGQYDAAMREAIQMGLTAFDEERQEHYLAVPAELQVARSS